jgi:hypothetical protein
MAVSRRSGDEIRPWWPNGGLRLPIQPVDATLCRNNIAPRKSI